MTTLYAWTKPAFWSDAPVDHTWVTTYDSRITPYQNIGDVKNAQQINWYCWGEFHIVGEPVDPIVNQPGSATLAQCLVEGNVESKGNPAAQGTIFTYGVDGVCHQLANQVLYATGSASQPPATVKDARGYAISSFLYGTYGLQHAAWHAKLQGCLSQPTPVSGLPMKLGETMLGESAMPEHRDDFADRARAVLGDDAERLGALLSLRSSAQTYLAARIPGFTAPTAELLNARNQHLLDQAALLLEPAQFQQLFGVAPGERVNLIDPNMAGEPRSGGPPTP
jgi:hypothetical protein